MRRRGGPLGPILAAGLAAALLAGLPALAGCSATINGDGGGTTVTGSGTPTAGTRQVSGFHEVDFSGVGELSIRQTGTESLRIEADANVLPLLTSTVADGRLTLGVQPGTSFQTSEGIRFILTVKSLDALTLSGAGSATGSDLATSALRVTMSGTGSVTLQGRADSLNLSLSGTGAFDGSQLADKTAKVVVGGTGRAVVNASDALDATVSGVGSVEYLGDPKVTSHITGVGTIRRR